MCLSVLYVWYNLGLETEGVIQYKPKIVRSLASMLVVQISCGYKHCMALTNRK